MSVPRCIDREQLDTCRGTHDGDRPVGGTAQHGFPNFFFFLRRGLIPSGLRESIRSGILRRVRAGFGRGQGSARVLTYGRQQSLPVIPPRSHAAFRYKLHHPVFGTGVAVYPAGLGQRQRTETGSAMDGQVDETASLVGPDRTRAEGKGGRSTRGPGPRALDECGLSSLTHILHAQAQACPAEYIGSLRGRG